MSNLVLGVPEDDSEMPFDPSPKDVKEFSEYVEEIYAKEFSDEEVKEADQWFDDMRGMR